MKTYHIVFRIISGIVVSFSMHASLFAATINIDTSMGNGADSYISTWPGERNMNFGATDAMYLKNDAGTGFVNRKGYLRFDLSGINNQVNDASLSLSFVEDTHATTAVWSFNVYGLVDGHAGENWSETGITWNNAPANNTGSGSGLLPSQAAYLGAFSIDTSSLIPGDTVSFGSAELTNFVNDDTNDLVTFILIRQNRTLSNVGFATKEHASFSAPTLAVSAVPIPGAVLLFGSGLFGLFGVRRHRGRV